MIKKVPYKIKDDDGNIFVFSGFENGLPVYRTTGGSKHIFDVEKYVVIQDKGEE